VRRRLCTAAALLAAACAGAPRGRPGQEEYGFPEAFEVTQVVTLASGDERREMLASLRRQGGDYEVTLFDPAFAVAILSASRRAGVVSEEPFAQGVRPGDGKRLVDMLVRLYAEVFPAPRGGVTAATSGAFSYRLSAIPDAGSHCRFPGLIAIGPRLGATGPRIDARTVEVRCR
jgi:hypothetical protein